jgi:subtilase family serine protease
LHIRARILGVAASVCLLGLALPASAAPSTKATLAGSVPSWAKSANFKGAAAGTDSIGFRVYLGWSNPSQVEALAKAVSDPKSASYKHFLTPQQFRQQFSPSQAQVGAVQSWLRGQGFNVNYTPTNNHYVSAEGTVAQAAAAFGTTFGMYSYQGLTLRSPSSAASIPSNLANIVSGVIGLDDSAQLVFTNRANDPSAPPVAAFVSATPCSSYWAEKDTTSLTGVAITNPPGYTLPLPLAPCGYTPSQIKGAYGLTGSPYDGSGQTVAIIDAYASPTIQADLNQWSTNRGIPSTNIIQVVAPGTYRHPEKGQRNDPQGWSGEETLDVEAVHGMAPGAHIVYVGAPNNFQDLDAALNHVVDRHLASIVTNSYGFPTEALPPGFIKPYEDTILQGAATGIGIYFSSGDNGDESAPPPNGVGYVTADWPASSPFVTAVGGTSLGVGISNTRVLETGWATLTASLHGDGTWGAASFLYGSGGGVSTLFPEPSYQQGTNMLGIFAAQGHSGRVVPDIAAFGDPNTGYLIGQTQTFPDGTVMYSEYRIGGTSLSSPIMAGIMALADQASVAAGHRVHGFANPLFYATPGAFYDVLHVPGAVVRANYVNNVDATANTPDSTDGRLYRLRTLDKANQSLQTTPGYDDVTGLGTPGDSFIASLK